MSTPVASDYHALASQVGGHPGVMTDSTGSVVVKPALAAEVEFYEAVHTNPIFEPLRPYVPKFLGTLSLQGQVDQEKSKDGAIFVKAGIEIEEDEKDSIVLENLSFKFLKPNIMDIKLGTILYERTASPEKRARMEKTARETTSLETGVRLTGFQVHDHFNNSPIIIPKSYGKTIKSSQLPEGIRRFFPMLTDSDKSKRPPEESGTGIPPDVLLPILECLREDIAEIKSALEQAEIRMVGGSLLIVYEADLETAREGVKYWVDGEGVEDEEENEEGEDSDEEEEGGQKKRPGPPYRVKLIDFAHTHHMPGGGPDEGIVFGVDTVLKLLDERIAEVKEEQAADGTS
ncbi:SAICAR synthase-like protein [Irpex rosettiformis]|uniref:SAICAR synthase-like protein n=1 Tax=Irpex rosettiformis TaxID=378272 RepID=A0ACB8TV32_9APHY|nr:SAICAR synthase-like protein [Irpex rosettiformis]